MFNKEQKLVLNGDLENEMHLKRAISLFLEMSEQEVVSCYMDNDYGLCLGSSTHKDERYVPYTKALSTDEVFFMVRTYLHSNKVKELYKELRKENEDIGYFREGVDGIVNEGWELYIPSKKVELEEGHIYVGIGVYAIFAIKPVLVFYGSD